MKKYSFIVGIDAGKDTFAITLRAIDDAKALFSGHFSNNGSGFVDLLKGVGEHATLKGVLFCLEGLGVYGEKLCLHLHQAGVDLFLADPERVHRSIKDPGHKTDLLDSARIAEYVARYQDELQVFTPPEPLLHRLKALLKTREMVSKQLTERKNQLHAFVAKSIDVNEAKSLNQAAIDFLKKQIKQIDDTVQALVKEDPKLAQGVDLLRTIPGVGKVLSLAMLNYTEGFRCIPKYRNAASHLGIAPREYYSGTSVYKHPSSRRYGPSMMRKLLYMSSLTTLRHHEANKEYFARKKARGKRASVIMNNLSNKQLKIMLAVLKNWKPYNENHQSIHPKYLTLP